MVNGSKARSAECGRGGAGIGMGVGEEEKMQKTQKLDCQWEGPGSKACG